MQKLMGDVTEGLSSVLYSQWSEPGEGLCLFSSDIVLVFGHLKASLVCKNKLQVNHLFISMHILIDLRCLQGLQKDKNVDSIFVSATCVCFQSRKICLRYCVSNIMLPVANLWYNWKLFVLFNTLYYFGLRHLMLPLYTVYCSRNCIFFLCQFYPTSSYLINDGQLDTSLSAW